MDKRHETLAAENEALKQRIAELEFEVRRQKERRQPLASDDATTEPAGALCGSERRLRTTMDSMIEGCQLLDHDLRYVYLNGAAEVQNRRPNRELLGNTYTDMWPGIEATSVFKGIHRCLTERVAEQLETAFTFPDGKQGWYDVRLEPVPEGLLILSLDITERKHAESKLRESESRLSVIFRHSPIGIVMTALADGQIVDVNAAFAELHGYSRAEMLGRRSTELNLWANPGERETMIRALREHGTCRDMEITARTKGGDRRHVQISAELIEVAGEPFTIGLAHDITRRKLAEAALRESEERLRSLGDNLPNSYVYQYTRDADGRARFLYLSAGVEKLHGRTAASILADAGVLRGQLEPDQLALLDAAEVASLTRQADFELELRICRADGQTRWLHLRSRPRRGEDGQVRWDGVATDVTARKQVEEDLRRTSHWLLASQRISATGGWAIRLDTGAVWVSPEARRIFGTGNQEFTLPAVQAFALSSYRPLLDQALEELIGKGKPYDVEYQIAREADGVIVDIHSLAEYDSTERLILGVVQDVTARNRAGNALHRSQNRYRSLFEDSPMAIWEVDLSGIKQYLNRLRREGIAEIGSHFASHPEALVEVVGMARILEVNAAARTMFEAESLEALLDGAARLTGTGQQGHLICDLVNIAEGKTGNSWETTGETLKGNPVEVGLTWSVAPGHEDDFSKVIVITNDISDRQRAEAQRLKLEEQLRVSQKMEAVGTLAGGVAHDFNNLLSVILSYTELALEAARGQDSLRKDLLEVKKASERGAALTRQLLTFSRKQILQPTPLNVNQIAEGVENMLRRILGEDIELVYALAPDLGVVVADPGQIEQVLMNLVVNARDAMPNGGKLIIETSNIEFGEEDAIHHVDVRPGGYVQLTVTDTGCGMDAPTKAKLFDPFFTTKEKGKGTGLGLSTTYGIVKQSGGNISVTSEPGCGTTFRINFPRDLSATVTVTPPTAGLTPPRGTETVLVVEDEEALREVIRRSLESAGYSVLCAADGNEALLNCAHHTGNIHVLLTDVVMPRMSGRALAHELLKARPAVAVLYMSGYTDDAIGQHGVLVAGTHFLAKPFTAYDLVRKVREVVDQGSFGEPESAESANRHAAQGTRAAMSGPT